MNSLEASNHDSASRHEPGNMLAKILERLSESADTLSAGPFTSVKQVLDFAIAREKESYDCYLILIGLVKKPKVREELEDFASDELQHAMRLEAVEAGDVRIDPEEIGSLGIADKVQPVRIHQDMSYADALVVAMRKEKFAFRLYTRLASLAHGTDIKNMFSYLAQEEAKHKLKLEIEYDLATF